MPASSDSDSCTGPDGEPRASNFTCPVCAEKTGKHTYYGARVCISCRGFFRRSVQSGQYPLFKCVNSDSGGCDINSKSRKSCKRCRFAKCEDAGMKVTYVMSSLERKNRIVQRYLQDKEAARKRSVKVSYRHFFKLSSFSVLTGRALKQLMSNMRTGDCI